jgi:hypothetical protein
VEPVGDETVVYDLESKEAHCLKPLAAAVFDCCDGTGSISDVAAAASRRLAKSVSDDEVTEAVRQLEQLRLLDTPFVVVASGDGNGNGVSRREALRRIGFVGAAATSATMITSIAVPTAAAAKSGIPGGCTGCSQNKDCASGHCCQSVPGKQCNSQCCVFDNNSCHLSTCTCQGGTTPGVSCLTTTCGGGGTCVCQCTVCISTVTCGACPCSTCPSGSVACCDATC